MDNKPDSKIVIQVQQEDGNFDVETPWATSLGNDLYRLENIPFFAYGVSWQDTVFAPYDEEEQRPVFIAVEKKSGNRTIRAIFNPPIENGNSSQNILEKITDTGAEYEGATPSFIAINIPPEVDLFSVCEILNKEEIEWEHADPTYAELYEKEEE